MCIRDSPSTQEDCIDVYNQGHDCTWIASNDCPGYCTCDNTETCSYGSCSTNSDCTGEHDTGICSGTSIDPGQTCPACLDATDDCESAAQSQEDCISYTTDCEDDHKNSDGRCCEWTADDQTFNSWCCRPNAPSSPGVALC